ncbi:site-specific DNA-methyltransferase [Acinetobacter sp. ANC 4945]|uniref:DNA methyltransferase n=1 Tax=Acinetobacter amyesii TaxID=2942470 RepID=UPI00148A62D2|nr:site-specific DNA-methyltransferase [Acinetobacter amyesii]MCL6249152.1 site-specific DNA-methyltransferase [Acinetobacter amyesii]
MASTQKIRNKLMGKLTELFQLDQPDLDFGFYRIMQAKSAQVTSFIDKDLLKIIEDAFGQVDENRKAELQANIQKEIEAAKEYGVADPENSPKVLAAKAKYDSLKDGANAEADVYDHLYRFFERYYDQGDFISRRYYARENAGKAAPFAIPYNGEEVKLHWANADQYYVKTAEYFTNFTFDLAKAKEVLDNQQSLSPLDIPASLKVHFRIVDVSEGEHGNVKAAEDKKRFFILHEENPIELNDADELVINFEYKALPGGSNDVDADTEKALKIKFGKSLNKGDMPNLAIAERIITAAGAIEKAKNYLEVMGLLAPTEKIKNRPLLAKYINQYTARNTCDYFIHKDLSGFLKRELDFYIKNEVMHLDDIENADAPAVENYLAKLKVIRKIATKLIDFLAQLENFQKKLWLKKKFITQTNYCITLDRVPEELYEEIAANDAQREEWVKLFAIDEISATDGDLIEGDIPGYSIPLTVEFLKANEKLVLDTAFYSSDFKARLIASIENFDEQCNGLLINSENFQALNLLQERYRAQVGCVYIDPPYNTGSDGFAYKDNYKSSSWNSMFYQLTFLQAPLLNKGCPFMISLDENQIDEAKYIIKENMHLINTVSVKTKVSGVSGSHHGKSLKNSLEYLVLATNSEREFKLSESVYDLFELMAYIQEMEDEGRSWKYTQVITSFGEKTEVAEFKDGYGQLIKIYKHTGHTFKSIQQIAKEEFNGDLREAYYKYLDKIFDTQPAQSSIRTKVIENSHAIDSDLISISYVPTSGRNKGRLIDQFYRGAARRLITWLSDITLTDNGVIYKKDNAGNLWGNISYNNLKMEGDTAFPNGKKPLALIVKSISLSENSDGITLDYFAGSGTTGHAVINLNRDDQGKRKFILVEMGDYFNNVTKPRISKVIYASDWKNGKPTSRNTGISQCFKYIRLESYEDTLNNLVFDGNPVRDKAIENNPSLKEDYMLRYLLDVETRGSQSLLNIDAFADPTAYSLVVKKTGSDEQVTRNIDLIETFNYLLGLRLEHMAAPQNFTASFTRKPDSELPEDQHTKLVVDGKIQQATDGKWWFRKLEGWVPADPMNPNNGKKEKVLIVWRKLTGNLEEDNLMLDEWFRKYRISSRESAEFDVIYVNGSNNLPNLKKDEERWKVRLIEESFHKLMWAVEGEA